MKRVFKYRNILWIGIAIENCHRKFVDLPNMVIFYGDINLPDVPEGNNP